MAAHQTQCDLSAAINAIAQCLNPALLAQTNGKTLSARSLHIAQKQLKAAKQEVDQLCKKHLEALLNHAPAANQHKKMKALKYLICAERNCQCYAQFRQHPKLK